jgi:5-formyltetrahydrofolate cyclo-ligase
MNSDISQLRLEMRDKRKMIPKEEIMALSDKILNNCISLSWVLKPNLKISVYKSFGFEAQTGNLIDWLLKNNQKIFTPKITGGNKMEMTDSEIVIVPANLDIIFVPGVVFDLLGGRIGMGKGYYDAYLPLAVKAKKIALAFDFQVLEKIPQNMRDQKVDMIVTEKRVIVC